MRSRSILDGEIVCLDCAGKSVFKELLLRKGRPRFYAFDLLWLNGEDLRRLNLVERKKRLKKLVKTSKNRSLLFADHISGRGSEGALRRTIRGLIQGVKKKRGDCSPLPLSRERQQLSSVLPCYRDKPITTSLASSARGLRHAATLSVA